MVSPWPHLTNDGGWCWNAWQWFPRHMWSSEAEGRTWECKILHRWAAPSPWWSGSTLTGQLLACCRMPGASWTACCHTPCSLLSLTIVRRIMVLVRILPSSPFLHSNAKYNTGYTCITESSIFIQNSLFGCVLHPLVVLSYHKQRWLLHKYMPSYNKRGS